MNAPGLAGTGWLTEIPLFAGLSSDVLGRLAPHLVERTFARGQHILREGEYCDGAYFLIEGRAESLFGRPGTPAANGAPAVPLLDVAVDARVGDRVVIQEGEIFGEGSALSRYPLATNIVALTDVRCLLIRTPGLRAMLDLPELASFKKLFDDRYRERTLRTHLRRVPLFDSLPPETIDRLVERAELVTFKPGKAIVREGEDAETFFLVRGGYVKVSTRLGEADVAVTYLRKGDWVGETALLLNETWPFTLTALEHVELVRLERSEIDRLRTAVPEVERLLWKTLTSRLKQIGGAKEHPMRGETLQFAMDSGLIHGESVLLIDLESCTRCDDCVRACADAHDGTPRFVREGVKFRNFSIPSACYQCTDPVCMIGCPTGAITRPLGTLEVTIDRNTCIGCGNCSKRCPWENIRTVPYDSPATGGRINLATKCDLCVGRAAGPACVQSCPHGAAVRVNFKQHDRVERLFARA